MLNQEAFLASNTGAVVVAAGASSRMGAGIPKQFQALGGRPVLRWSVDVLLQCTEIVVVVVSSTERARVKTLLPDDPRIVLVDGGAQRTESVRNGLQAL